MDGLLNSDLRKPPLLAPLLGVGGLGPTSRQWRNFSPVLGLAWAPPADGKTVIRAGAGLLYGRQGTALQVDAEGRLPGPTGHRHQGRHGGATLNPLTGIPASPV